MPRIRSTHPGQWNDDDFIDCSPFARLLILALRNFADDSGIFEWKPKQIKRLCLPSDTCDVVPLLQELVSHHQVTVFEVDGREFGAIRNFRLWQRPKTPNSIYPLTNEIRKYVGLKEPDFRNGHASSPSISEMDGDEAGVDSSKGRNSLSEVGGRRKEEGRSRAYRKKETHSKKGNGYGSHAKVASSSNGTEPDDEPFGARA